MGYYTGYSLSIHKKGPVLKKDEDIFDPFEEETTAGVNPITYLRAFSDGAKYAIDSRGYCSDHTKWYQHDEDMIKLTKAYPGWVFELHGEGEESGDFWNKYYKDGKMQLCGGKIVYPPYDESKLA